VITCAITTWPTHPARLKYLATTLGSLKANMRAGDEGVKFLVSSESQPKGTWLGNELIKLCFDLSVPLIWHPGKANLGAHLNFLFDLVPGDIWFYCQDDFQLKRPLDLSPGIRLLDDCASIAAVRYYTLYASFKHGVGKWREVDLYNKLEPWPFADNPFLAHRRWRLRAGAYVEGGDCGVHETTMIDQVRRS
jgi:hypothetical protein